MARDLGELRSMFPALQQKIRGRPVVYLDSACITIPPRQVVEAVNDYYTSFPACHGRSAHRFGQQVTEKFEEARAKIQSLVNAKYSAEIVFVRNATEGINLVAQSFYLQEGDTVLCSDLEHNSNLLPWQRLAVTRRINHRIFKLNHDSTFNLDEFTRQLDPSVKLISLMHTSNVTGVTLPVKEICREAHSRDIAVLMDATQGVPLRQIEVQGIDVDFLVFSMHKAYGPSGVGVLYGKRHRMIELEPLLLGGESVDDSTYTTHTLTEIPHRFEAGLQNYAGVIGSAVAADFLMAIERDEIAGHNLMLNTLTTEGLNPIPEVRILGPQDPAKRGSVVNFLVEGKDSHHLALLLDESTNIMVRPGKHCVHSWYNANGLGDSVRVSFGVYNTENDVDTFLETLKKVIRFF